jgi:polyferredoxin
VRQRDVKRRARIKSRAQWCAGRAVWGLKLLLIGILALATAYSFGWGLPFVIVWWVQYVANAILLILLIFSLASFWNGTTVESIARRCEVTLEKRIERKLVELAEE